MSSVMEVVEYSPVLLDEIIAVVDGDLNKEATKQIVGCFERAGLPIKVKRYFLPQLKDTFRVLCFIKKSSETVIVNTDGFGFEGLTIQLRILNSDSFVRLDELSENIRNQILTAGDCSYCSIKCDGKRYVFTYNGSEHSKCQMLCSNFRFKIEDEADIAGILKLVEREIEFAARKKK